MTANPRTIGRFEVVGKLASGGMAEILLGRLRGPEGFERPVVIKRVHSHLIASDPRFVTMFLDEARISAMINHPNVAQVQELGHHDNDLFLVMEYLEGESLAELLRKLVLREERLPPELCTYIVAEACAGLHAAHELTDQQGEPLGVVHRDVSPQNIFVTYSGDVKILDFGIAVARERSTKTETGELKGKFRYMSPEQCVAKPLDRRSDIFALGIVLYELLTCRPLFARENQLLTLRAIVKDPIAPPSTKVDDLPAGLDQLCLRALSRDPKERPQTAADFRRELVRISRDGNPTLLGDDALKKEMLKLFAEQIQEKSAMLRSVQNGVEVSCIPVESEPHIKLPSLLTDPKMSSALAATPAAVKKATRTKSRKRWVAAAVLVLTIAGLASVTYLRLPELVAPSPLLAKGGGVDVPAPLTSKVTFKINSRPQGATVTISGTERGTTPIVVKLPKGPGSAELQLNLPDYQIAQRSLSLQRDQTVSLSLMQNQYKTQSQDVGMEEKKTPQKKSAKLPFKRPSPPLKPKPKSPEPESSSPSEKKVNDKKDSAYVKWR